MNLRFELVSARSRCAAKTDNSVFVPGQSDKALKLISSKKFEIN